MIYMIGYEQDNPFWVLEGDGAGRAGKDFGVTVRYEAPTTASHAGMVSLVDAALATLPYGIAIDYTDKTMQAPVLTALNAGTRVVLYNNDRFESQSGGATTDPAIRRQPRRSLPRQPAHGRPLWPTFDMDTET